MCLLFLFLILRISQFLTYRMTIAWSHCKIFCASMTSFAHAFPHVLYVVLELYEDLLPFRLVIMLVYICFTGIWCVNSGNLLCVLIKFGAPCGPQVCQNRPNPFPGWMCCKATKPGFSF